MRGFWAYILALAVTGGAVIARPAFAQPAEVGPGGANAVGGEVDLKVLQFGAGVGGGLSRPGSWIGVQVQVTDQGTTTREIVLELSMPDVGGDTALYQTTLALGGEKKTAWLYARLPFDTDYSRQFVISAYTTGEPSADQRASGVARVARRIGRQVTNIPSSATVSSHRAIYGVVGRSPAGLERYEVTVGQGSDWPAVANEAVVLDGNLTAASLPDRWMGLAQFDALIWTSSGPELEPTDLGNDRAQAIREWVQRGGHLIVVLPPVGQAWTNPAQPLYDIMPKVKVKRNETADLNPYRPILTDDAKVGLPTKSVLQTFEKLPDAKEGEATAILSGFDNQPIVVRRTVGAGAVTLIGVDVAGHTLSSLNANKADVFWHRILGRRGIHLTGQEISKELQTPANYRNLTDRGLHFFDTDIGPLVNKTGHAAAGVLLAFSVFGLYWLCAGPLGFWILRKRERSQHAWVGFAVAGVIFTAVAWSGATVLRPGRMDAQHLTLLDHVYGQDVQHARMWASVLLPRYGAMRVGIEADKGGVLTNTIAPWNLPPSDGQGGASTSTFPDARGYGIDSRSPDKLLVPARSTVKTFTADWAGGPQWKMPMPVNADGSPTGPGGATLRITGEGSTLALDGALRHDLPAALKDVYVIVVRSQQEITNTRKANRGMYAQIIWQKRQLWNPGDVWDFSAISPGVASGGWQNNDQMFKDLVGTMGDDYQYNYAPTRRTGGGRGGAVQPAGPSFGKLNERLAGLSLFNMLEPPDPSLTSSRPVLSIRNEAHGADVSRWFTQPCVIIIGHVENASSPVPLTLNGEPLGTMGHTVVRWIYPLPESPPRVPLPN